MQLSDSFETLDRLGFANTERVSSIFLFEAASPFHSDHLFIVITFSYVLCMKGHHLFIVIGLQPSLPSSS